MEFYTLMMLRSFIRRHASLDWLKVLWFIGLFSVFFGPYFPSPWSSSIPMHDSVIYINLILFAVLLYYKGTWECSKKMNLFFAFLILWLVWSFLSISWAMDRGGAAETNSFLFKQINLILFTALYFDYREVSLKWFYRGAVAVFACYVLVGWLEMLTGYHLSHSAAIFYKEVLANTPTGFFHNPNDFAALIAIYLPFLYSVFVLKEKRSWVYLLLILLSLMIVIQTKSRASFLGLVSGLSVWVLLIGAGAWKRKFSRLQLRKSVFLLCFIALVLIFFSMDSTVKLIHRFTPDYMFDMASDLKSFDTQGIENSSGVRKQLIKNGFIILRGRGLNGVGAGNVETYMMPFKDTTRGMVNMHNWWMEMLVCYGVPFALLFMLFYVFLLYRLLKAFWREEGAERLGVIMASVMAMTAFFFGSISPSSIKQFNPIWVVFGIALGAINSHLVSHEIDPEEEDVEKLSLEGPDFIGPLPKPSK